jgi:predicted ATP-grasp superfamily ATP-dependent carboligase
MLAQAAAADGFEVVSLDLFGDRDTRQASAEWVNIGARSGLAIDGSAVLQALDRLSRHGGVVGWVAGSGFEAMPALLEQGATRLPLIGTPAASVRRVRDPSAFFAFLDAHAIAHPPVRMSAPADPAGWLLKDAGGTGGWHIRDAVALPAGDVPERGYFQLRVPGEPMSATFIANGSSACVLGFNQLIVKRFGSRPFVYCGAIGPAPLDADVAAQVSRAASLLTAEFSLRGLCSLDFVRADGQAWVLEINPRPSASMGLYAPQGREPRAAGQGARNAQPGWMWAHVQACLEGELPGQGAAAGAVNGHRIVFAPRPLRIDEATSDRLAVQPQVHDLPWAGSRFEAGDPVCSISASGPDAAHVRTQLSQRRQALLNTLETPA